MGINHKIKNKLLDSSDRFRDISIENKKLKKQNKKLKKQNKKLKKQNKKLKHEKKILKKSNNLRKNDLTNCNNLISYLFDGIDELDNNINYCPFCKEVVNFDSFGNPPRPKVLCKKCNTLERHRFSYLIIKNKFPNLFDQPCKVLHFAPEHIFYEFFKNNSQIDYYPVDINPKFYKNMNIDIRKKVNMEEIPFDDNTFEFIYNCHVLEHVPDDIKAMEELFRVLKDDGFCLTAVPLFDIPETFQNDEYNTPELRLKYYGQEDHLRMYGNDFKGKLESVGFKVEEVSPTDISEDLFIRKILGLNEDEKFFICTK